MPFGRTKPEEDDYQAMLRNWIEAKYLRKEFLRRQVPAAEPTVQVTSVATCSQLRCIYGEPVP